MSDDDPGEGQKVGSIRVWNDAGRLMWEYGLPWLVEEYEGLGVSKLHAACGSEEMARTLAGILRRRHR